jgi:hypothetical protein
MEFKNNKQIGEIGERIVIGELAKYGIDVVLPMSDNLPFDFIVFYNNKLYKCQVKSTSGKTTEDSYRFSFTSNNWNNGIITEYTEESVDIFIGCNLKDVFLFKFDDIKGKKNLYLRDTPTKNGQIKGINFCKDFIISKNRISEIFN